jgi:hypothetical protein
MKIKIFNEPLIGDLASQKLTEKLAAKGKLNENIEYRVNQFIAGKKIIKLQTSTSGDALGGAQITITVLYEE